MTAPVTAVSAEDLVAITSDVWTCFLGDSAPLDVLPGTASSLPEAGTGYVASVAVTGSWNGQVLLELGRAGAERAARTMLGGLAGPEETADAVGELANMVGGNVKALVPSPSVLGLPVVVHGARTTVRPVPPLQPTCSVSLSWAGDPVRISVWQSTPDREE